MEKCPYLNDRERLVFELFYRKGWPIEDIAAKIVMGKQNSPNDECSKTAHRSTVNRTLDSIREKTWREQSVDINCPWEAELLKAGYIRCPVLGVAK